MKRILLLPVALLAAVPSVLAQAPGEGVEMATLLHRNGKIYLVVLVLLTIFAGVLTMLIRLERRIKRLEDGASRTEPS